MPKYPTEIFGIARDTDGVTQVLPASRVKDNIDEHMEIKDEAPTLTAGYKSLEEMQAWGALIANVTDEVGDFAVTGDLSTAPVIAATATSALAVLTKEIKAFYTNLDKVSKAASGNWIGAGKGDATVGNLTVTGHGLAVDDRFTLNKAIGTAATTGTIYFVTEVVDANTIKFALTKGGDAIASTAGGGADVAVTAGTKLTKVDIIKYVAEYESLKFNDFQKAAMEMAFRLKRFAAAFDKLATNADTEIAKSMYPSGNNPATGKKL